MNQDPEVLARLEARFPDLPREVLEVCLSVHQMFAAQHGTEDYEALPALDILLEEYGNHGEQVQSDTEEQGCSSSDA